MQLLAVPRASEPTVSRLSESTSRSASVSSKASQRSLVITGQRPSQVTSNPRTSSTYSAASDRSRMDRIMDKAKEKLGRAQPSYSGSLNDHDSDSEDDVAIEKQKAVKEDEKRRQAAVADQMRLPPRRVANAAYRHLV